jgi:hypothetical protein
MRVQWIFRSLRFWSLTATLAAGILMLMPKEAYAACGPCGPQNCIEPGGGACWGVGAEICYQGQRLVCEYQWECAGWHGHGPCM